MAYNSTTDNLLSEILNKTAQGGDGAFPSWNGRTWVGSGVSFSEINSGNILKVYSGLKYNFIEEMVYMFPSALEYTNAVFYPSADDINASIIGTVLTNISAEYLGFAPGSTSIIQIRKIDFELLYNPATVKYKVLYKIYANLWYF
jgi:hypothetical protein